MIDFNKIFPPIETIEPPDPEMDDVPPEAWPRCARCNGVIVRGADDCEVTEEMSPWVDVRIGGYICRWCFTAMAEERPELTGEPVQKVTVQ